MVLAALLFSLPVLAGAAHAAVSMQTGDSTALEVQAPPQVDPHAGTPYGQPQPSPANSEPVLPFYHDREGGAFMMRTIPRPVDQSNPGGMYYPYGGPVYVSPEIYVQPPWGNFQPGQNFPGWRPGPGQGVGHGKPGRPGMRPSMPGMHPGPVHPDQFRPGHSAPGGGQGHGMTGKPGFGTGGKPGYNTGGRPGHGMGGSRGQGTGGGWQRGHGPSTQPKHGGRPAQGASGAMP